MRKERERYVTPAGWLLARCVCLSTGRLGVTTFPPQRRRGPVRKERTLG